MNWSSDSRRPFRRDLEWEAHEPVRRNTVPGAQLSHCRIGPIGVPRWRSAVVMSRLAANGLRMIRFESCTVTSACPRSQDWLSPKLRTTSSRVLETFVTFAYEHFMSESSHRGLSWAPVEVAVCGPLLCCTTRSILLFLLRLWFARWWKYLILWS